MAVDAEGDRDRRVAKALLDNPRVHSALQCERRPGVPQAMHGQPRQPEPPDLPFEGCADGVGV